MRLHFAPGDGWRSMTCDCHFHSLEEQARPLDTCIGIGLIAHMERVRRRRRQRQHNERVDSNKDGRIGTGSAKRC